MIAIVTDSTANLTKEEAAALGIRVVPISYTVSGQLYHESYSDQNGNFENLISQNSPRTSTSQATVATFMSVFAELIRNDYEVFCLVISSRLSGVYSSASVAAKEVDSSKIIVVDSLTTAGGLAHLLKVAKTLASKGATLNELALEIEKRRNSVGIVFSVDNMDALRKSGRLGIVRQSVGTILNIRPVLLCVDGVVVSHSVARGSSQQIKTMLALIPNNATSIIIHYLSQNTNLEPFLFAVKQKFADINIEIRRLGPSLGIHLGTGVIGISWITQ